MFRSPSKKISAVLVLTALILPIYPFQMLLPLIQRFHLKMFLPGTARLIPLQSRPQEV